MSHDVNGKILGLGIDTGGTYTDAAIVDLETRKVLAKRKAPTTYNDLSIGLNSAAKGVFEGNPFRPEDISLVGISTTLATNSVLEGKGGEVGLILIGWDPKREVHFGERVQRFIKGGHDVRGRQLSTLDMDEVDDAIREVSKDTDAIAVSGIFSVVNPSHERKVRRRVRELTDLPVVVGHDLATELGIDLRTETAVLNGKLIPIVNEFFNQVENTFRGMGIDAPIMVFKGDGSIMDLDTARERPVETILSGPAASSMGGKLLAGLEDCIIVDVGGTSTDIAILKDGFPMIQRDGASVGKWRTRVKAVDMWTSALGGDSHIQVKDGRMSVGPERVVPLAMAVVEHPELLERMERTWETKFHMAYQNRSPVDEGNEAKVHRYLKEHGPSTLREIRDNVDGVWLMEKYLTSLKRKNLVVGIGLTPTDLLHYNGTYLEGDRRAAEIGVAVAAHLMDLSEEEFVAAAIEKVHSIISGEVVKKLIFDDIRSVPEGDVCEMLLENVTGSDRFKHMRMSTVLDRPIVAVGAPSHVYVPPIASRLGTEVIVPPSHEVGNAVGAVCSKITEVAQAEVHPTANFKFVAFAPNIEPLEFSHIESAKQSAKNNAIRYATRRAEEAGAVNIEVKVEEIEYRALEGEGDNQVENLNWIEINVRAIGDPMIPGLSSGKS
jgi:N-methylhydantoinase A/oxoprolinase/acetone carboxylase beta subunit